MWGSLVNRNEKMILLGSCEGTELDSEIYSEIAARLSEQLPELEIAPVDEADESCCTSRDRCRYGWRATVGEYIKVNKLADALWDTYRLLLQAHGAVADKIKLVFKLQDHDGNFVRVQFADPYSDKSIYMHCFQENMASAFGRA